MRFSDSIQSLLTEIDSCCPNPTEMVIVSHPFDMAESNDYASLEPLLEGWSKMYGHALRERGTRNPFLPLTLDGAKEKLVDRLQIELVFRGVAMDGEEAKCLSDILLNQFEGGVGVTSDFLIDDWTFCEVLIVSDANKTVLIAFLGED